MEFSVLGSGSAGNSAVIRHGDTTILADAGLSAKQLTLRLQSVGVFPDELSGIVLTHEHSDHTRGLDVFLRNRKIPIYCSIRTREMLRASIKNKVKWFLFGGGDGFTIGDIAVSTFSIPHDAAEPIGIVFGQGNTRLGLVSDAGHVTKLTVDRLMGVDSLFVEANYDMVMLQNDTKRPWSIKQRISSSHGHLSNAQTAELVSEVGRTNLNQVVLGHLSQDCNAPDVAVSAIRSALAGAGLKGVQVRCACQNEVTPFLSVARENLAAASRPELKGLLMPSWTAQQQELF